MAVKQAFQQSDYCFQNEQNYALVLSQKLSTWIIIQQNQSISISVKHEIKRTVLIHTLKSCHLLFFPMQAICESKCVKLLQSCPTLCNPMDCVACWAPLSMAFSRQEYCSRLLCPPPRDLPNPGIEPVSYVSCVGRQARSLPLVPPGKPLLHKGYILDSNFSLSDS